MISDALLLALNKSDLPTYISQIGSFAFLLVSSSPYCSLTLSPN
jgi:hypothetical protein